MMDHAAFIATLPPETRAQLTETSDRAGLLHLAGHLGAIAVTGTFIALKVPFWWVVLPVHGVLITFLFTLAHEATHKTPFKTSWLNEWAGRLAGLPILLPFTWFRYFHLAHHRHTNDPHHDPELRIPKPETWPAFLWHLTGFTYWRGLVRQLWVNASGRAADTFLRTQNRRPLAVEARWMLAIYGVALASLLISDVVLWLWIVPILLGQPFLRLYLLAEHARCPAVANMFENTRTTFTTRLVRFFAWNMPFHAEHHAYPTVPFHKLPDLHQHAQNHLLETSDGYGEFAGEYVRNLTD